MYKITVNKEKDFAFQKDKNAILINNQEVLFDISQLSTSLFHLIKDNKSYNVEIVKVDYSSKVFKIKVNNIVFDVDAKDELDLLLDKMGLSAANASKIDSIKAPMPGLIFDIKVTEGQEVKKGDPVMILEAMKMENVLKSPGDGIVKAIKVNKGDKVEKNQVLIQF